MGSIVRFSMIPLVGATGSSPVQPPLRPTGDLPVAPTSGITPSTPNRTLRWTWGPSVIFDHVPRRRVTAPMVCDRSRHANRRSIAASTTRPASMEAQFPDVRTMVAALKPSYPVYCLRPHVLCRTAQRFLDLFPGRVLYAVKCNPHPRVLQELYD